MHPAIVPVFSGHYHNMNQHRGKSIRANELMYEMVMDKQCMTVEADVSCQLLITRGDRRPLIWSSSPLLLLVCPYQVMAAILKRQRLPESSDVDEEG